MCLSSVSKTGTHLRPAEREKELRPEHRIAALVVSALHRILDRADRRSVADYVLSGFDPTVDVAELVARAADAAETMAREGLETAQQRFN